MSLLRQEIDEQPAVLQRLLDEQQEKVDKIAKAIQDFDPVFISIAARGTSDNAARYAKYVFGKGCGLATTLAAPSLHTIYETPPDLSRALVIGISQSGQAEDVRTVLENARNQGACTLAITNFDESPMAQTAEHHLSLLAGEEVSIAATKTYTAQLMNIAMLAAALVGKTNLKDELQKIPQQAQQTLDLNQEIGLWAQRYRYMERFAVLGRGYNYATAFEISLKVKELAYIASEGYSEADFRHGPIAIIQHGFPVMVVAPHGAVLPMILDVLTKLEERHAETLVISNAGEALTHTRQTMRIPSTVSEWLTPIVAVIPGQIFAMHQALIRGYEVDKPRGLSKVTVTK